VRFNIIDAAYYNEFDPYAAQWLRNLIAAGHIAPGDVDERSIEDIHPYDLIEYTQCHFFAGIGVWSYALRLAGWSDAREVWTGSCPCQPFSAAGAGGGFADERHLWPAFYHLIDFHRPPVVLGEQVASKDANPWIDLVQDDMEGLGYGFGSVPFPAASVGAPHIRDRLYWMAYAESQRRKRRQGSAQRRVHDRANAGWLEGEHGIVGNGETRVFRMDHADDARLEGLGRGHQAASGRIGAIRPVAQAGESGRLAHAHLSVAEQPARKRPRPGEAVGAGSYLEPDGRGELVEGQSGTGPTNGMWRDADWLFCRDGKWRPVESGTFPLAHGATSRVGRLRAYGNAINAQQAKIFIEIAMQYRP
jgi:DNA (cytosine-5)-methyltransferase 1